MEVVGVMLIFLKKGKGCGRKSVKNKKLLLFLLMVSVFREMLIYV